ncbi:P-type Ca(2+) transporter [Malassezia vespertilionis]|uniref:P-type Ca(2+) transporter n=1 Tax=Malassezia vespertilionis TaxID=2020962 RepID=UPI0024B0CAC5|nr:P-type Ca(2+) transporter [Malassezia vespertilionis]WFD07628.1 P-type Ca(2+) transporter [Malassezia vespertilionis]
MAGRVAVDRVLQSALPLVPEYGFTLAAVRKAIESNPMSSATSQQPKDLDRVLAILFPGPDTAPTSAPRRLFQAWDDEAWASTVSNFTDKAVRDAKAERIPCQAAFDSAVHLLSDRLSYSTIVQPHLLPPEWYALRTRLGAAYGTAEAAALGLDYFPSADILHMQSAIEAEESNGIPEGHWGAPPVFVQNVTAAQPNTFCAQDVVQPSQTHIGDEHWANGDLLTVETDVGHGPHKSIDTNQSCPMSQKKASVVPEQEDDEDEGPRTGLKGFISTTKEYLKGDTDRVERMAFEKEIKERLSMDPAPFLFSSSELCSLIDPEDIDRLHNMGGTAGLMKGLETDPNMGLCTDKCEGTMLDERRRVYGSNNLPQRKSKSLPMLMWLALQDKVLILLIVAAIVSLALGLYQDIPRPKERIPCLNPPPGFDDCQKPSVDWVEGVAIMVAVVIVDLVGSLNDWQKERQFRALDAKKDTRDVSVLRNGNKTLIDIHDVLVGDIIYVEPGDMVDFDGVVLKGYNVKCDESSVTGESDMIAKVSYDDYMEDLASQEASTKHKSCFMISGSKVNEGIGEYVVTAVGPLTFYGKLMLSLRAAPENTPLQAKLNRMAELIAKLGTAAGVLLFTALMIKFFVHLGRENSITSDIGKHYGEKFINILIISVTIIVVAVPEGLPLAVTLALAFATRRMSNRNLLVRVLSSCETMANATCICTDKTGTLTQNKMHVVAGCIGAGFEFMDSVKMEVHAQLSDNVVSLENLTSDLSPPIRDMLTNSICINSTAFIPENKEEVVVESEKEKSLFPWLTAMFGKAPHDLPREEDTMFIGSKTEIAMLSMVQNLQWGDFESIREQADIIQIIPFASRRKAMGVVVKTDNGYRFYTKGASEVLLQRSTACVVAKAGESHSDQIPTLPMDEAMRSTLETTIHDFASQSLRTISMCYRNFDSWPPPGASMLEGDEVDYESIASDLTMLGIFAIEDPLRPGVKEAVRACTRAGVQVKMCTGDNLITACSIAVQCGIYKPGGVVIEGPMFRQLSDEDLTQIVPNLQVLARSSPDDKKKLIDKLKRMGEVVAVTGDGTNDGPALKSAHVGFSMGLAGSEVAKEASDIILLDDNFSSIVDAIKWGRCVNDSVRKFLQFQITVNIVAVVVTFVSAVASEQETSVLTAVQLLWLNLIMDTLAALALATDPPDDTSLDRKPDKTTTPLVTTDMWKQIAVQSIFQIILVFVLNFRGSDILNMSSEDAAHELQNNIHLGALIFNVFVWCQLFNEVNARRLDRNLNIFQGIRNNLWFVLIIAIEIGAQVLIMFKGGQAFSVTELNGRDWGISIVAGFVSWPLGVLTRLCPTQPIEDFLIRLHLMPDPNALPVESPEAQTMKLSPEYYNDWNEPAVGRLAEKLGAFSRIRGGRLRASNLVMKSSKRRMREKNVHPQDLLAIVPAMIGASVGGGWKHFNADQTNTQGRDGGTANQGPQLSARTLYKEGKLRFHPNTLNDTPYLLYLSGESTHY